MMSGGISKRLIKSWIATCYIKDIRVTGDMLIQGEPAPDPYLKEAEILKFCHKSCLVFVNAPLGIVAAKSVGMNCVAVS